MRVCVCVCVCVYYNSCYFAQLVNFCCFDFLGINGRQEQVDASIQSLNVSFLSFRNILFCVLIPLSQAIFLVHSLRLSTSILSFCLGFWVRFMWPTRILRHLRRALEGSLQFSSPVSTTTSHHPRCCMQLEKRLAHFLETDDAVLYRFTMNK